ncbi:hypothetical protein CON64_09875 [Bacillus pseudomycoides]|nr:hypothetical protein CON64_09875 [Bacillus pseudomycoides]
MSKFKNLLILILKGMIFSGSLFYFLFNGEYTLSKMDSSSKVNKSSVPYTLKKQIATWGRKIAINDEFPQIQNKIKIAILDSETNKEHEE